jgi:hypothetical protein
MEEEDGHITNPASGKALDINGGATHDGAQIILYEKHGGIN